MPAFFSPLFLIGMLGASIPIIIHLINRKKALVHRFAAIEFVLKSHERFASRFKFRQLLLLILRALLVALLSMALAKPFLEPVGGASLAANVPTCNVIIIDDSFSMGYTINDQSLFEKAKHGAERLINSLSEVDEAAILSCTGTESGPPSNLSADKNRLLDKIDSLEHPSHFATKFSSTLLRACSVLDTSRLKVKRVFLLTDLTKTGWDAKQFYLVNNKIKDGRYKIILTDVSGSRDLNNAAITDVKASYDPTEKDAQVGIKMTVSNFSPTPVNELLCQAIVQEEVVAQGFINVDANSTASKDFYWEPTTGGWFTGRVGIAHDNLKIDDTRHFVINITKDIAVLVVDGDQGTNIYESESFYLEKALDPGRFLTTHIKSIVTNPTEVGTIRLNDFDLIFLCNVETLPHEKIMELHKFVSEGGGLVFTLGDRIDPQYYNKAFSTLLPNTLRTVKEMENAGFATWRSAHPAIRNLHHAVGSNAHFNKIFLVDPRTTGDNMIILKYANEAPALIEKRYGKGIVMLFTSTIDRDWNDLPVKPVFLPLIQQLCRYLTGTFTDTGKRDVLVGERYEIHTGEDIGSVRVTDPQGNHERLQSELVDGQKKTIYTGADFQGIYNINPLNRTLTKDKSEDNTPQGSIRSANVQLPPYLAVNVDTTESNLSKIQKEDVTKLLGGDKGAAGSTAVVLTGGKDEKAPVISGETRQLWGPILLITLCILCLEAFVSKK